MFQRTRIRLTILNSLVFIILIGVLATVIYSYAKSHLYEDINKDMLNSVKQSRGNTPPDRPGGMPGVPKDPRIITLVWDEDNEMIDLNRNSSIFIDNAASFRPKQLNKLRDTEAEGFRFRTISVKGQFESKEVTVQFVRNITSEEDMLETLLLILTIGSSIGGLCAVGAGFFLAGRALVPIKKAWYRQQEFVSDASHELRTPLAVIQSKTDILWRSPSSTIQEKAVDISVISKECRRMTKLVKNLLTLARSDSDQLKIEKEEFSLSTLLHEIMEYYLEVASYQEKTIQLNVPDCLSLIGDKERIHQLMIILIDNALKYTEEGAEIIITCSKQASTVLIMVKDNGIGITEDQITKIFDRFFQVDKSRTDEGGAGLGLSIAKWIIDNHNGKVKVNSELGKGTSFEITLPL